MTANSSVYFLTASSLGHGLLLSRLEEAVRASNLSDVSFRPLKTGFRFPPFKLSHTPILTHCNPQSYIYTL